MTFEWDYPKIAEQITTPYTAITYNEWQRLQNLINQKRREKGLDSIAFTPMGWGENFKALHFNEVIQALLPLSQYFSPNVLPSLQNPGDIIYASYFDQLKNAVNGITGASQQNYAIMELVNDYYSYYDGFYLETPLNTGDNLKLEITLAWHGFGYFEEDYGDGDIEINRDTIDFSIESWDSDKDQGVFYTCISICGDPGCSGYTIEEDLSQSFFNTPRRELYASFKDHTKVTISLDTDLPDVSAADFWYVQFMPYMAMAAYGYDSQAYAWVYGYKIYKNNTVIKDVNFGEEPAVNPSLITESGNATIQYTETPWTRYGLPAPTCTA